MRRQDTSSATKILWGQILIVSIVALFFVWAATQWVAFRLGFQPQLGAPLTALFGLPIYRPWQVFTWWYWYDAYAPGSPPLPSRSYCPSCGRVRRVT